MVVSVGFQSENDRSVSWKIRRSGVQISLTSNFYTNFFPFLFCALKFIYIVTSYREYLSSQIEAFMRYFVYEINSTHDHFFFEESGQKKTRNEKSFIFVLFLGARARTASVCLLPELRRAASRSRREREEGRPRLFLSLSLSFSFSLSFFLKKKKKIIRRRRS